MVNKVLDLKEVKKIVDSKDASKIKSLMVLLRKDPFDKEIKVALKRMAVSGDDSEIKLLIKKRNNKKTDPFKKEAYMYLLENVTGDLKHVAFLESAKFLNEREFKRCFKKVKDEAERLKILKNNRYAYLYPDEFVKNWSTSNKKSHNIMIYNLPSLPFAKEDNHENRMTWIKESRAYSFSKIDSKIINVIESTILSLPIKVKVAYAAVLWADLRILNKMKEETHPYIKTALANNEFFKEGVVDE